jgi:hypothetical protein
MRLTPRATLGIVAFTSACLQLGGEDNVVNRRLDQWADRLVMTAQANETDAGLVASISLSPQSESSISHECPHFKLQATVNGVPAKVRRNLTVTAGDDGWGPRCLFPTFDHLIAPERVRARVQTSFPDASFVTDIVTRLEVTLEDESGRYVYNFASELPSMLTGQLSAPLGLLPGARVEVHFDPAPARARFVLLEDGTGARFWVLPPTPFLSPPFQFEIVKGFERTTDGFAFDLPTLSARADHLTFSVSPWVDPGVCPFAECRTEGKYFLGDPFISLRLPLPPP